MVKHDFARMRCPISMKLGVFLITSSGCAECKIFQSFLVPMKFDKKLSCCRKTDRCVIEYFAKSLEVTQGHSKYDNLSL